MKRLHVHLSVPEMQSAIKFYSQMFGSAPTKQKPDYAKWQLEDPMVNFAISTRSSKIGLDHLGIQVSDEKELTQLNNRLSENDIDAGTLDSTTCCYAESVKSWSFDPAGIPWENFITMKDAEVYGEDNPLAGVTDETCCPGQAPVQGSVSSCC
jgi:catechol-2,3-dioxygenase